MGGKNLKTNSRLQLPRKRVVRAEFNTCERHRTGCTVQNREISVTALSICVRGYHDLKLSCQNTEFRPQFKLAFALTPLRSAIIISVSVRSAERRLVLYV